MKLLNFTIIKLTLCLIVGIIVANFLIIPLGLMIYICIGLIISLLVSLIISKNKLPKNVWFGTITFLTMICIGILVVNLHDQRQFNNHYSKIIPAENEATKLITFQVREVLKPTAYHNKYVVDILKVDDQSVSGKLLLNVQKDSISKPLDVDDILMSSSSFSSLSLPLNPYQFNYNSYLKKQYIDHQIFLENHTLLKIPSESHTILGFAAKLRSKIDQRLKTYNFKPDELAIIDALLLGQRKDISQDTYNSYVNAGAIHILAVSGLHVGIILWLLNWVFKPIERIRHGKRIKTILLVLILWFFAVIAGLSPSVTRAVGMFTVVAIGMNLNRPANIYNTLAISMFFLLLIKPLYLFDVGFQMSYTAVLAIASIKPLLAKLWTPKWKLVNYFWQLTCVTTAAQIGVVPISLFYFHQFPGLFFLSNLVILPFLGFILGFGIIVIILALSNLLPPFIADLFGFCISTMNDFISWVSHQERFVFTDISFGFIFLLVAYFLIISLFLYFKRPKFSRLVFVFVSILLIQAAFLYDKHKNNSNEFVIFHKSKISLIGIKEGTDLKVAASWDSITQLEDKVIKNYKVGNAIKTIESLQLQSVYQFENQKLLIVDSLSVYQIISFKPDYILLRNSPKLNLNRLIDSLGPKLIIADGSNYKSYVSKWKETCDIQKIPFHITSEKGAFIYKY
jgi:competence protein ComEC